MKYRCWYLGHAWGRWTGEILKFGNFHHDYIDHFVDRWRYCERCGKKTKERYFVPGISPGVSYNEMRRHLRDTVSVLETLVHNKPADENLPASAVLGFAQMALHRMEEGAKK